jgi:hypothetical protein
MRAGSVNNALSSAKTPVNVTPSNRSGSEISHTMGARKSASSASGQLMINRINHATNRMSGFIDDLYARAGMQLRDPVVWEKRATLGYYRSALEVPPMLYVIALLFLAAQADVDPCPTTSSAWIELSSLPDSLAAPPQFFFDQPTVPLDALIVCAHGIFFNVHAPQDSVSTEYYVSFPLPTHEEFVHYVPQDTMLSVRAATDPAYIDNFVDRQVANAAVQYDRLKTDLRRLLGKRYEEKKRIDLAGSGGKLKLGFPLTLLFAGETLPFNTYPGIYWRR